MNPSTDSPLPSKDPKPTEANSFAFGETQWSMVINAGHGDLDAAALALERLCRIYWRPIYAFVRWQRNMEHPEAEDLTQSFFAHLLEKETLKKVDRRKGKFRTYLLAALSNFLSDEKDRQWTQKRGGRIRFVSMDEIAAGDHFESEPSQPPTPEKYYDRQWAHTLLQRALARLRAEYTKEGGGELCAKLERALNNADTAETQAELAVELGMNAGAVRVALHRLRRQFREILRDEVAQTVATPAEADEELRHLIEALAV